MVTAAGNGMLIVRYTETLPKSGTRGSSVFGRRGKSLSPDVGVAVLLNHLISNHVPTGVWGRIGLGVPAANSAGFVPLN